MNKRIGAVVLAIYFVCVTLIPQIALATPLTGADADVGIYWYKGMSGFQDDTTDANDADESGDVDWPATETKGFYVGHLTSKFTRVYVNVSSAVGSTGQNLEVEYWNGSAWTALTLSSQTYPFDTTGINYFVFSAPSDWATTSVNGGSAAYFVRGKGGGDTTGGTGYLGAFVSQVSVLLAAAPASSTPEFTDMMYIATLVGAIFYASRKFSFGQSLS